MFFLSEDSPQTVHWSLSPSKDNRGKREAQEVYALAIEQFFVSLIPRAGQRRVGRGRFVRCLCGEHGVVVPGLIGTIAMTEDGYARF